jgi:HD-like signal output (HDOD) protein
MENSNPFTNVAAPMPVDTVAAVSLLDLFRDPDRDIDSIVEFISNHPALMAETLKRCNQVSFRGSERITDVFEAVSRLGFYELYDIISASIGAQAPVSNARLTAKTEALEALPRITL